MREYGVQEHKQQHNPHPDKFIYDHTAGVVAPMLLHHWNNPQAQEQCAENTYGDDEA